MIKTTIIKILMVSSLIAPIMNCFAMESLPEDPITNLIMRPESNNRFLPLSNDNKVLIARYVNKNPSQSEAPQTEQMPNSSMKNKSGFDFIKLRWYIPGIAQLANYAAMSINFFKTHCERKSFLSVDQMIAQNLPLAYDIKKLVADSNIKQVIFVDQKQAEFNIAKHISAGAAAGRKFGLLVLPNLQKIQQLKLNSNEIKAVLAHEMGHIVNKHLLIHGFADITIPLLAPHCLKLYEKGSTLLLGALQQKLGNSRQLFSILKKIKNLNSQLAKSSITEYLLITLARYKISCNAEFQADFHAAKLGYSSSLSNALITMDDSYCTQESLLKEPYLLYKFAGYSLMIGRHALHYINTLLSLNSHPMVDSRVNQLKALSMKK